MNHTYKGHEITVKSAEIRPARWNLRVKVEWTDYGINKQKPLTIRQSFTNYDEAITHGLLLAKHWIDGRTTPAEHEEHNDTP